MGELGWAGWAWYGWNWQSGLWMYEWGEWELGWHYVTDLEYHLFAEKMSWTDAEAVCQQYDYGHLATVIDVDFQDLFVSMMDSMSVDGGVWIGYTDEIVEGEWKWIDGSGSVYTNWAEGEPNDSGDNEDCGQMYFDGSWNDNDCSTQLAFICE